MYRSNSSTMSRASIGKPAPPFTGEAVVDGDFQQISLSDYKGRFLVLFFYPGDFTFVCPTEIIALSNRFNEFDEISCSVVAVSTDSKFCHFAWITQPRKMGGLGDVNIPILSDQTLQICRDYGVLKSDEGVAYRGLFIIDGEGIVRQITINDLGIGRSIDEILRLVKAIQFVDKHGLVCPVNWKPGDSGLKTEITKRDKVAKACDTTAGDQNRTDI
ncbi:hypothetical protein AB6A40_007246 [Gnathostoma spinigerum]|uniref:thioredoxin-dependent peroxiredoxin n=1 Tax=Gnathostoma spinigerum TaxID=75299 RepID=A0ABD6EV22_9BILA